MIKNIYIHRKYIWNNAWNDLRFKYSGTAIGLFWNIVNPLLEVAIYLLVFSQLFVLRNGGISSKGDYAFYLLIGLLPWISFSESIISGSSALVKNKVYINRLDIPLDIYVAISALASFLNFLIYCVLLSMIAFIYGNMISWEFIILIGIGIIFCGLTFGISLILAKFQVLIPDVREILRAVVHLWRWTLPIVYTIDLFPENFRWVFQINPPYIFIESIRSLIIEHRFPGLSAWGLMILWAAVFIFLGTVISKKIESDVKDEI